MKNKYNINLKSDSVTYNLHRLINQTYKLLPLREEGVDWIKPLETIVEEIAGMNRILVGYQRILFSLLCKLEGLFDLKNQDDFSLYRRVIFECLSLMSELKEQCQELKI